MWMMWWVWVVAGVALAALEVLAPGYFFLGFAIGAVSVGVIMWTGLVSFGLPGALLAFAVISLIGWAVLRAVFPRQSGDVKLWDHDINDN